LSQFDFDMKYIEGPTNVVADTLSCRFKHDNVEVEQDIDQFVDVDTRLDPEGEDLPKTRKIEA
jgi:hypothetical protein